MKKAKISGQYPDWHSMPLRLTKKEIEQPSTVMLRFIDDYNLPAVRQNFEEILNRVFMTKVPDPLKYIWFREEVERFIEAAYIAQKKAAPDLREFLAVISHELQNQLAGMHTLISTMESYQDDTGGFTSNAGHYLELMKTAVLNARSTYTNIQKTSVVSMDGLTVAPSISPFNPYHFFIDLIASMGPIEQVQENKIKGFVMLEQDLKGNTDTGMLQQVFTNLVLNAFKYSKPGKSIKVTIEAQQGWLNIKVRNLGDHIPKESQVRLFEPYFVLDKGRAGSGLGLYICKQYCIALGGDIEIASTHNGINIFSVHIPITYPQNL